MIAVWDPAKAAANHRKHGIRFVEALAVLFDPLALGLPVDEVDGEERQATRTERRHYEEGIRFQ